MLMMTMVIMTIMLIMMTTTGAPTIRAFNRTEDFITENEVCLHGDNVLASSIIFKY